MIADYITNKGKIGNWKKKHYNTKTKTKMSIQLSDMIDLTHEIKDSHR